MIQLNGIAKNIVICKYFVDFEKGLNFCVTFQVKFLFYFSEKYRQIVYMPYFSLLNVLQVNGGGEFLTVSLLKV